MIMVVPPARAALVPMKKSSTATWEVDRSQGTVQGLPGLQGHCMTYSNGLLQQHKSAVNQLADPLQDVSRGYMS